MNNPMKQKDERIDFRVTKEAKALIARAAEISGVNMSAFIVEAARERAIRLIEAHERLVLGDAARDLFMATLTNPPSPSEKLQQAAQKYRQA